jgi:2-oxoglutarate ferredoxin oxidoreductase subunit gamma
MSVRLIFSGSGGQGVITAAILLAEAAVLFEGINATQTQSYGAEARGGATRSDVILSDTEILYPMVSEANIVTCLTQQAYDTYAGLIRPGGLLLTDSRSVKTARKTDAKHVELPLYDTVLAKVGKPIVYNICMLGALIGITEIVHPQSVLEVLKTRLPGDLVAMNQRALDLGLALGAQYQYQV